MVLNHNKTNRKYAKYKISHNNLNLRILFNKWWRLPEEYTCFFFNNEMHMLRKTTTYSTG